MKKLKKIILPILLFIIYAIYAIIAFVVKDNKEQLIVITLIFAVIAPMLLTFTLAKKK